MFVPPFIFLFLVFFFFSQYLFLFFEVAIVLDIVEGQWRGEAQKWTTCHMGKNTEKTGGPKKRKNVIRGKTALVQTHLTDRFFGRNVQGATATASQLQALKRPTHVAESFHLLNVIRKLVREFARQSPKEPMPSAIVKAAYMRVVPETHRRAMETQVDEDKVEPTTWKIRSLLSSETTHPALHQWTSETLHQDRHRHQVSAVPVRVPRQVRMEGWTVTQT